MRPLFCFIIVSAAAAIAVPAYSAGTALSPVKYDKRCYTNIPKSVKTNNENPNNTPVSITANKVNADLNSSVNYSGDVEITQGIKVLRANSTTFDQNTQDMEAEGDIFYQDGQITVNSDKTLKTNLSTNDTSLDKAEYQINGSLIRGEADHAILKGTTKKISLHNAYVTTCPSQQESWKISSSEIKVDQNEIFGEAYNTVFWLHDIPVFYLPYINFPIKNERKSGFLYPSINYTSDDGAIVEVPIYWNIAPNYDYTFTPVFIARRGLQLKNEFRYMPFQGTYGKMYGEYIEHDRRRPTTTGMDKMGRRWFYNVEHSSIWDNGDIGVNVDYSQVKNGDYNYKNDFSPYMAEFVDNQLSQDVKMYYDKHNFDASIELLKYQLMIPESSLTYQPFKLLPRIALDYHDAFPLLSYNTRFEYSNFSVNNYQTSKRYKAERYHAQPEIVLPFYEKNGIDFKATGRFFYTAYDQKIPSSLNNTYLKEGFRTSVMDSNKDRVLYSSEIFGGTTFSKHMNNGDTLTVEPMVQYMYIPYRNQDSIGLYDTTDREYNYYSIFSYKRYAGLDRISDSNRLTYALTHRWYDNSYHERLRFDIGQAYDFVPARVKLYPSDDEATYPRTPIAAQLNVGIIDEITGHADIVYNSEDNNVSSWNILTNASYNDYQGQLSYRYTRDGNRTMKQKIIDLKQLGGTASLPLNEDWKVIGAMYYDLEQSNNIDQKLAVRYESCCYNVGFQIERYNKPDNYTLTSSEETKYGIFFELKGLAGVGINSQFSPNTKLLPQNDTVNLSR